MRFEVGDLVVHSAHGMGRVVRLVEKRLQADEVRLYYEILMEQSTIWVPVETRGANALRELTPRAELARYRAVLMSRPRTLNENYRQRRLELSSRLKSGVFGDKCEVVRDLTAHGWRKPLSDTDAASLHHALATLGQEWAESEGISADGAKREISALLLEARNIYAS